MSDTITAAIIGVVGTLVVNLVLKYDLLYFFNSERVNISGNWTGKSIYVTIDICNETSEFIYEFTANIKQFGRIVFFNETILRIYNLHEEKLELETRKIKGRGRIFNKKEVLIQFREAKSHSIGSMYLSFSNNWGTELSGLMTVSNPYFSIPATVKIKMRPQGKDVDISELNFSYIKKMAEIHKSSNKH